jgi:hypothetical protein
MSPTPFCLPSYQSVPFSAVKSVTLALLDNLIHQAAAQARPAIANAAKAMDK